MNFIIVNDIRQEINIPSGMSIGEAFGIRQPDKWIHHATIKRGFKEYIVFRNQRTGQIYLEEVEQHRATLVLHKIQDDNEWQDLHDFCKATGVLNVIDAGTKVAAKV